MSPSPGEPSSDRRRRLALAAAVLAFALVAPVMNAVQPLFRLPFGGPGENHGIVSASTVSRTNPLDNFVFYAAALAAASTLAVLASRLRGPPRAVPAASAGSGLPGPGWQPWARLAWAVFLAAWLYNVTWVDIGRPLDDTFHEGEWLGFLPALSGPDFFGRTFLIHGPGMNALPARVGAALGGAERVVVWARAVRRLECLLAWATALVVLWQVLRHRWAGAAARRLFLPAATLFALMLGWVADTRHPLRLWHHLQLERSLVGFLLLATLLSALRHLGREPRPLASALRGFVAGALVPLGFLYNYSEGAGGLALAALALVLATAHGRRPFRPFGAGAALGVAAGAAAVLLIAGGGGVAAMVEQMGYWSRFGRTIWSVPLRRMDVGFWIMVLAQAAGVGFLAWRWRVEGSLRGVARLDGEVLLTLAASLLAARAMLDRPEFIHTTWGAVPAFMLVVALASRARAALDPATLASPVYRLAALGALTLAAALHAPNLDPPLALARLRRNLASLGTPDAAVLLPDYARAREVVAPELAGASCFYTLTSEGAWYYLLGLPACSRFHQLLNARTDRAQREVVEALQRERPPVILHSNGFWSGSVDGVPFPAATPAVARYVAIHYRPGRMVGQHWFWRRIPDE